MYGCRFWQNEDAIKTPGLLWGSGPHSYANGMSPRPEALQYILLFEDDIRSRTFDVVKIFEFLLSFQAGLPAIIHKEECDTEPPIN